MSFSALKGKFHSALWFLKRPNLYPQFFHLLKQKLRSEPDTTREAEEWCAGFAVDSAAALKKITGKTNFPALRNLHAELFRAAEKRAEACPVKMGGPGAMDLLYYLAEHVSARNVVETGVAYGWSSLALLLSLQNRPGSRLISTDMPYLKLDNDAWVGCVVPKELKASWEILRLADRQGLPKALAATPEIDLCHYDSDKTHGGRAWAYPKLWRALRKGGIFLSDDIGDNLAFRDFVKEQGLDPIVMRLPKEGGVQYVGVLVKA